MGAGTSVVSGVAVWALSGVGAEVGMGAGTSVVSGETVSALSGVGAEVGMGASSPQATAAISSAGRRPSVRNWARMMFSCRSRFSLV